MSFVKRPTRLSCLNCVARSEARFNIIFMTANILAASGTVRTHRTRYVRKKAGSSSFNDNLGTYRLSTSDMFIITAEFHNHRLSQHPRCHRGVSVKMMEAFLSYVSSGGYYRQVARSEGISKPTMIMYSRKVSSFLSSMASQYICLPSAEQILGNLAGDAQLTCRYIRDFKVIGLLDGFLLKIQRPDNARDEFYSGRPGKCYDCMNVQYVCDLEGELIHVVTGVSGRAHDKNAVEWSPRLRSWLDGLPENYYILGDSAYIGFHDRCLTLLRSPQDPQDQEFNARASYIRSKVENVIGAQECVWRLLMSKENRIPAKYGLEFACDLVFSVAVLHNRFTNYVR